MQEQVSFTEPEAAKYASGAWSGDASLEELYAVVSAEEATTEYMETAELQAQRPRRLAARLLKLLAASQATSFVAAMPPHTNELPFCRLEALVLEPHEGLVAIGHRRIGT